ncbi:MAG: HD domain-containing protein [Alphaproteobacteria bacterium]|nr:HD domain-containing protein [Alphaproteobacteria bacterium]
MEEIQELDILSKDDLAGIEAQTDIHLKKLLSGVQFYRESPISWNFSDIAPYIPPRSSFLNTSIIDTTHGIRHILRVMIYSNLIAQLLGENSTPAIVAAAWHDLRRQNDFSDKEHGERGFSFFYANKALFKDKLSDFEIDLVAEAIRYHDNKTYESNNIYLKILKTADALDRYRLKNEPGWPKLERIPLKEGIKFAYLFHNFTLQTEYSFLECKNSLCAIKKHLDIVGGINDT